MKFKVIIIMLFMLTIACKQDVKGVVNVSVSDVKTEMTEGEIQLLDVRTPEEWSNGVIKGAEKINFYDDNFEATVANKIDMNKPVYVYCKSGGRSLQASELLVKKGYKVYNMLGGYDQWKEKYEE